MNQTLPQHSLTLGLLDRLNRPVDVHASSLANLAVLARHYGAQGLRPRHDPVPGGLQLPYALHDTFDWSLIGAFPWSVQKDGETIPGVMCGGHFYTRRVLDEVDSRKLKLPAAVKYSRGARQTDPEHLREQSDGEFQYVTLVMFRGSGRAPAAFELPGGATHALALAPRNAAD